VLNDRERRALARIERYLVESDPDFARIFTDGGRSRGAVSPTALLAVGLAMLVLGCVVTIVPLAVLGMVCSLGALGVAAMRQGGFNRPMTA
jgi:hypothetical protein